jgi:hypothetical protein
MKDINPVSFEKFLVFLSTSTGDHLTADGYFTAEG